MAANEGDDELRIHPLPPVVHHDHSEPGTMTNSMSDPPLEQSRTHPGDSPLALDPDLFRTVGHALVDRIAAALAAIPAGPVTPGESPEQVRALLDSTAALPERGMDTAELMSSASDLLFSHSLFNGHPRFLGYVTASPAPIGMLGDLLAAAVNPNVGAWTLSPAATEIEAQTVRWIAELIGFPKSCGGLFVSGGNMANFIGFVAARAAATGGRIRTSGLAGSPRLRVYASTETHTWLQKAADLFGLGTDAIRWLPTDGDLRVEVDAIRAAIESDREAGDLPMMVVGTAGTVSTGAIDPLPRIGALCEELGVWFHVDGAYGGFAAAAPEAPADLLGIGRADSVAVDPHKWLYAPLEAGCALVRDPRTLVDAFSYHPPYYHFETEAINYFDHGFQNSRGFRALKVWLALRQVGREGYARMIGDDIRLAGRLHDLLARDPEFEVQTLSLSITTFRYVPPEAERGGAAGSEEYLNELNQRLLDRIQRSGEAFVSQAVIRGRFVLRACIVNFNTAPADIDALPDILRRHGREVHGEMRGPTTP
jgi:aromatic-L-amino-acid/L-tryptophan decarboxylase